MGGDRLKILILGGYGTFGGRLAQLLAADERLVLVIAGRSQAKAEAFIATLPAGAGLEALALDRNGDIAAALAQSRPDLVVDASGPFQAYGDRPYRVVEAAIDAGCNYMDLADGSDFVIGITQFEAAAQAKGVFALSGVSSFPVLSSAAVRALTGDMTQIGTVIGGVAPSPHAIVGENVVRAILSYAGHDVALVRGGRIGHGNGLTETRRFTVAAPGQVPLRNTRFSLVDVPDLRLLGMAHPGLEEVWIGAGTRPEMLHRVLNACAWLVRLGLLPTLRPLAPIAYRVLAAMRWGEHRGGMFIAVTGTDKGGQPVRRSWHLLAEGDDGPFIPSMAVEALVLKLLAGETIAPGARAASGALMLEDYAAVFAGRKLFHGLHDDSAADKTSLYRRILGEAFEALPLRVRQLHDFTGSFAVRGRADVDHGGGFLAGLVRRVVGFPKAGRDIDVRVTLEREGQKETWKRNFAGTRFSSVQTPGTGRNERLLLERFGPIRVALAVIVVDGRLKLVVRGWDLLGIPMPAWAGPTCDVHESERDGRFHFHVELGHPWIGLIVRYVGWLEPVEDAAALGGRAHLEAG